MAEADLEKELTLIGVVGSADKMQEDVATCVQDFIEAGIKVWIVTGDKDSTAKAVGYQSGILSPHREILQLTTDLSTDKSALIDKIIAERGQKDCMISGSGVEVLLTAIESLTSEKDKDLKKSLVDSFLSAKSFVVYRSSPKQKAALVKFVRTHCKNKTTLAIGDGANDVNMI